MNQDTKNNLKIEFLKKAKILSSIGIKGIYLGAETKKIFQEILQSSQKASKENLSLMMIGENLEESKEPGKLLNKILSAMGLTRKEVFIFSEIKKSEDLISNQDIDLLISKASPKIVICFGSVATNLVLDIKEKMRDVRNKFYNKDGVKVISTYHPAALIHDPSNKKFVWDDMKLVMEEIKKIEK